jgi:hypothetical protein
LIALLLMLLLGLRDPSVTPRPIGLGVRYHPAAAATAVRRGAPIGEFRCSRIAAPRYGVHVELFAQRTVVVVPAGIGVAAPFQQRFGTVTPRGCSYPLRTLMPTGVVEVRAGSRLTLGDLFTVWGQPLARRRLAAFRSTHPVLAFVGGRRWPGDPRAVPLTRHAQIVLEIGGYVPPHSRFLFPKGL